MVIFYHLSKFQYETVMQMSLDENTSENEQQLIEDEKNCFNTLYETIRRISVWIFFPYILCKIVKLSWH